MSAQWEVVGKKKKEKPSKAPNQKSTKDINNRKVENLNVKIEEVLAKSQVKNLYATNKNKENKSPEKKTQDVGQQKKVQKKTKKAQEAPKPKSIESALIQINVNEFKSTFEKSKLQFPDAPIVWLKELSLFLNQKVSVELQDPVFTSKPSNYPYNVVPPEIKSVIEKAIKDSSKDNIDLFFNISVTSMASDMNKNSSAIGHKLLLQHISSTYPHLVISNLTKLTDLVNSYQNRPNIGSSILWASGQVRFKDINAGIKVFEELMLPLIEMKNYSRYVVKYLLDLINSIKKEVPITKEQYLAFLETVYSNKKNIPTDLKQELISVISKVKDLLFVKNSNLSGLLELYLKKLNSDSNNKPYQDCLCDVLVEYFSKNSTSLSNWSQIYSKNVSSSVILLKYIDDNWKSVSSKLDNKVLRGFLNEISETNEELLSKKKKETGLNEAVAVTAKLTARMASKKKSGSSKFKTIFFIITLAIVGLIYYDIKLQGSWKSSRTNKFFKDIGVCEHTHNALDKVKQGFSWVDGHIEETFPGYHKTLNDFAEPYVHLIHDLSIVVYNVGHNMKEVVIEKYPVVVRSIDSYAPGLVEHSQNAISNVWSTSVLYYNRSVDYLKTEVFVGQLSPENMQRVVTEALNTTQNKAIEYYHWLYEKVQTSIK